MVGRYELSINDFTLDGSLVSKNALIQLDMKNNGLVSITNLNLYGSTF